MRISTASITNNIGKIAGIEMGLVATLATLNQAAAKINPNGPIEQKIAVVLSRFLGSANVATLYRKLREGGIQVQTGPLMEQGVNIWGPLNTITLSGGGTLLADWIISMFGVKHYSKVRPLIAALGSGLVLGGIIGGLLDPDTGVRGGQQNPLAGAANLGISVPTVNFTGARW